MRKVSATYIMLLLVTVSCLPYVPNVPPAQPGFFCQESSECSPPRRCYKSICIDPKLLSEKTGEESFEEVIPEPTEMIVDASHENQKEVSPEEFIVEEVNNEKIDEPDSIEKNEENVPEEMPEPSNDEKTEDAGTENMAEPMTELIPENPNEPTPDNTECNDRHDCLRIKGEPRFVCILGVCSPTCTDSVQCNVQSSNRFFDQECFQGECRRKTCSINIPSDCAGYCEQLGNRFSCGRCSVNSQCSMVPQRNTCIAGKCK